MTEELRPRKGATGKKATTKKAAGSSGVSRKEFNALSKTVGALAGSMDKLVQVVQQSLDNTERLPEAPKSKTVDPADVTSTVAPLHEDGAVTFESPYFGLEFIVRHSWKTAVSADGQSDITTPHIVKFDEIRGLATVGKNEMVTYKDGSQRRVIDLMREHLALAADPRNKITLSFQELKPGQPLSFVGRRERIPTPEAMGRWKSPFSMPVPPPPKEAEETLKFQEKVKAGEARVQ